MIVSAVIFILLGVLIKYGKAYNLIAGYNTLSEADKAKYNIEKLAHLFFIVMLGMGVLILLGHVLSKLTSIPKIEDIAFWTAMVVGIPILILRGNSSAYKH